MSAHFVRDELLERDRNYGVAGSPSGGSQSGGSQSAFGASQSAFGASQSAFGGAQSAFGGAQSSLFSSPFISQSGQGWHMHHSSGQGPPWPVHKRPSAPLYLHGHRNIPASCFQSCLSSGTLVFIFLLFGK